MSDQDRLTCLSNVPVAGGVPLWHVLLAALLVALFSASLAANEAGEIFIEDAHAWASDDSHLLDARFAIQLGSGVEEALENGVPLTFELQIQLVRKNDWLWDVVETEHVRVRELQYHALSRSYQVRDVNEGTQANYSRLDDALIATGTVDSFLFTSVPLDPDRTYIIRLRGSLDIESLPTPVRLLAYVSEGWDMNSEWYAWLLAR
jgi:hypothetical protein